MIELKNVTTGEIEQIAKRDVLKIDNSDPKGVRFYTSSGVYKFPNTLEDLEEIFYDSGHRMLDRTNLVNVNQVANFNPNHGVAEFYDSVEKASVAQAHKDYLAFILKGIRLAKPLDDCEHEYLQHGSNSLSTKFLKFLKLKFLNQKSNTSEEYIDDGAIRGLWRNHN